MLDQIHPVLSTYTSPPYAHCQGSDNSSLYFVIRNRMAMKVLDSWKNALLSW